MKKNLVGNFFLNPALDMSARPIMMNWINLFIKGNIGNREKLTERSGISEPRFET